MPGIFVDILAYRRQDLISCGFFFVYSIAEFDTRELLSFGENCAILQTGNTTVRFLPTAHRSGRWGTTLLPFLHVSILSLAYRAAPVERAERGGRFMKGPSP